LETTVASMSNMNRYQAFEMNVLIYCQDNLFLPTMSRVLSRLGWQMDVTADYDAALTLIAEKRLDVVVIDWQEVINLGEFLERIRTSRMNREVIQVVIARDLMDMRQAFSAGIQFLIHKPASVVQIAGCLEAMQGAVLKQRRRGHREPVRISAAVTARNCDLMGATIVNLSNDGLGLMLDARNCKVSAELSAGSEIEFAYRLPEVHELIVGSGVVMWINRDCSVGVQLEETRVVIPGRESNAGVQVQCISETDQANVERWVAERFDRFVARLRESLNTGCA
jgi:DNA-binding response OmpR family regulator